MNNMKEEEKILEDVAVLKNEVELLYKDVNLASKKVGDKINKNTLVIAGAILLAGAFIGLGLFFSAGDNMAPKENSPNNVVAVSKTDHIRGSMNAAVKIIEFSDLECPFCKSFHQTVSKIMAEYGVSGNVAWVYRHFPLVSIHPKALREAQASECAAELGGNDKFWAYIDRIFAITPSNNGLDPAELSRAAAFIGLDTVKFDQCLVADKYKDKIAAQTQDAVNSGAQGTPYSVVITRRGEKLAVSGALPYDSIKQIIEQALK